MEEVDAAVEVSDDVSGDSTELVSWNHAEETIERERRGSPVGQAEAGKPTGCVESSRMAPTPSGKRVEQERSVGSMAERGSGGADDAGESETGYLTPGLVRWRSATDVPLMILAIGSLPMLLLELKRNELPAGDTRLIDVVNVGVLVAFAIDYVIELGLARNRSRYVRHEYLSLLIVCSQAVALVPSLASIGVLRSLRAARLFRFGVIAARAFAIGGEASRNGRRLIRKHAASIGLGTAAFTWIMSAAAFTIAEDVGVDGRIHSFYDALWWSLGTITTAGSGEFYPVTAAGRIVGGFTMIVGISTFAVVTAKVAEFLVRSSVEGIQE
jgi:voltage-gated potassium channel